MGSRIRPIDGAQEEHMENVFYASNQKKIHKKRGELFSFFEIFTAEFSHFLVTKKLFFLTKK